MTIPDSIRAPLAKAFGAFKRRSGSHVGFPIARDWLIVLILALFALIGSVGYATFLLWNHSVSGSLSDGDSQVPEPTLNRASIEEVIDAYAAKDVQFSNREDVLVEVADPSL